MTTLDQITCEACGYIFHRAEPERRIGTFGNYDIAKTCPECGHQHVDFQIGGRVDREAYVSASRKAVERMKREMWERWREAIVNGRKI